MRQTIGFKTGVSMNVTDEPCPFCGKVRKVLPKHPKKSEWRLSLQSFLPTVTLAPVAAPKDDQTASEVLPPTTLTPSTTPYQQPYPLAQSPLERLPLEIWERICQLVGLKNSHPVPRWMRYVKWEDRHQPCNRRRCCQKSLCALSRVSKSMVAPAQRALFENIILDKPRTLVNLCKSLLLYPKNRGYIRHLVVRYHKYIGQRFHYDRPGERHSHPYDQPDASAFVNLLGPVIMERGASSPWATNSLRQAYSSYRENPVVARIDNSAEAFRELTDTIFALVVHFSPSLQSLAIRGSGKPWLQPFQYSRKLFLDHSPSITTLTLDCSVLQILFQTEYSDSFRHPCLSTVQDLTLNGFYPSELGWVDNPGVIMVRLFDWFCTNPRLRRLEINKFDETVFAWSRHNWNTILLKFRDTLRYLSMSGYKEPIREDQMIFRFGPSRMLTCLPELEKLAYLRAPLHFVSSHRPQPLRDMGAPPGGSGSENSDTEGGSGDSDTDDNHEKNSITADNIRQRIMTEFPPSLKTADIIEYLNYRENIQELWNEDEIRERETYHLAL